MFNFKYIYFCLKYYSTVKHYFDVKQNHFPKNVLLRNLTCLWNQDIRDKMNIEFNYLNGWFLSCRYCFHVYFNS